LIDKTNGEIALCDKKLIIKRGLTENDFITSKLYGDIINQSNSGLKRYYIRPQLMYGNLFVIILCFGKDELISMLQLALAIDGKIPSWDNWSEEVQFNKKKMHDEWLLKHIGLPPYQYEWGSISSNYDPRSSSSIITIRYKS
jgi:hypothetical protein